jgi:hypothetical protein
MTNSELRDKLEQAQALLADVCDWAGVHVTPYFGMENVPYLQIKNPEICKLMSVANSCIVDALSELEKE